MAHNRASLEVRSTPGNLRTIWKAMFKSAKFNRVSKSIVEQIRQAILQGKLKPGDRLPPEKELAENFGVSKASLREAFRALEAMGFLEVRQGVGGGAFVQEVDLKTASDGLINFFFFKNPTIEEYSLLRSFIEPQIAELAAQKITSEDLDALADNVEQTKKALDNGSFPHELEIDFHGRIAASIGNSLISLIVEFVESMLSETKEIIQPDYEFALQVYVAHQRIFDALRVRDPEAARMEMLRHVKEVEEGLLACRDKKGLQDIFPSLFQNRDRNLWT